MDLQLIASSPAAFRDALIIDSASGSPEKLGSVLDDWQRQDFLALDPAWQKVAGQDVADAPQRAWLERPRGHSKTADLAVMCAWALAFSRRQLVGVAAAADRDQARLLRDAISRLVAQNPWLSQVLDVQQYRVANLRTGSELDIISSDAATSYGLTPDFVVIDEISHHKSRDLWDSLLSSSAKRANCLLVVITNAGFQDSWQYKVRELIRENSERWLFRRLDGPVASWITPAQLAEQERLLPGIAFQRLWLNCWTSGSGDAIDPGDLQAAFASSTVPAPQDGFTYLAGLDLGLSRDAAALVVVGKSTGWIERKAVENGNPVPPQSTLAAMLDVGEFATGTQTDYTITRHPGDGRIQVVSCDVWQPAKGVNVDIEQVEHRVMNLHQQFGITCLAFDPWQAAYLAQRLAKRRINCLPVPFQAANLASMATETVAHFRDKRILIGGLTHNNIERLREDLSRLRIVERSYGIRLDSPRGPSGHGDAATALALALHAAKAVNPNGPPRIDRPLLIGVGSKLC